MSDISSEKTSLTEADYASLTNLTGKMALFFFFKYKNN